MTEREFVIPYESINGVCSFEIGDTAEIVKIKGLDVDVVINDTTYTLPLVDFILATKETNEV